VLYASSGGGKGVYLRGTRGIRQANRCWGYTKTVGFCHYGVLIPANYGIKKTNVFLIPPAYTKTPHECKGLQDCFGRGFFEGS